MREMNDVVEAVTVGSVGIVRKVRAALDAVDQQLNDLLAVPVDETQ